MLSNNKAKVTIFFLHFEHCTLDLKIGLRTAQAALVHPSLGFAHSYLAHKEQLE